MLSLGDLELCSARAVGLSETESTGPEAAAPLEADGPDAVVPEVLLLVAGVDCGVERGVVLETFVPRGID